MPFVRSLLSYAATALVLLNMVSLWPAAAATRIPASLPTADVAIRARHIGVARRAAAALPRQESDQAVVDGWPMYRTERGQSAFNAAMATLQATQTRAPQLDAFKGCTDLQCPLALPPINEAGWLPAGRLWVSPETYIIIAHSPRLPDGSSYRRRSANTMKYFIFHEFQNSSSNTDPYDTISSHDGSVYVPLYLSRQRSDAQGRQFVVVVQVAPYDVVSIHAVNLRSAGPGMEVAKNNGQALDPLQAEAGIVIAAMIKTKSPGLMVVNHRGVEGLPMLQAYRRRMARVRALDTRQPVALPFVPADPRRVARAAADIADLVLAPGATPRRLDSKTSSPVAPSAVSQNAAEQAEAYQLIEPVRPASRPPCARSGAADPVASCRLGSAVQ